jgi:hypothetical protein
MARGCRKFGSMITIKQLRSLAAARDSPWPPFMTPKEFQRRLWPLGRTALFTALRLRKFHSFLLRDGLSCGGVRVIDTASALAYLASLSEAAKKEDEQGLKQRKAPPAKRTPQQRQSAVTS